ncbi:MAG: UvrB/UvrC motif-containing protein [Lachnospiraceae bacterium]|nr:UvrB/UvrC motif-containing protein [Lachnospiraceae bacterium]
MLCEKCKVREARVKITRVINGVSETHNLCPECASSFRLLDTGRGSEWSNAIFRLLSDAAVTKRKGSKDSEDEEKLKQLECPGCHKTYGAFLEDGTFGCPDCYEAFSPYVDQMILSMQGADAHTGKKSILAGRNVRITRDITEDTLTPEQEAAMLRSRLEEAVFLEDYDTAARIRDELKKLEKGETS